MSRCPNCNSELSKVTDVCPECGQAFKDTDLCDMNKDTSYSEESSYIDEDVDQTIESDEELSQMGGYSEIEMKKAAEAFINQPSAIYVKKSDKYEDLKSTAATFLLFGICGLIFVALNLFGIISFLEGALPLIVMTLVFVIFIIIGITSYSSSKVIKGQISKEEDVTVQIKDWLTTNITNQVLDSINNDTEADEVNFFHKIEYMKEKLKEKFPSVSDSYLEQLIEEFYNDNF
jgi:Zn-finger nucleic acid-binding protein